MIKIIAGGKEAKDWVAGGILEYKKRLLKPFDAEITYLDEEKMAKFLSIWPFTGRDYVILLDERGKNISSPELSQRLTRAFSEGKQPILIIGGAYGVSPEVRERADFVWSFSNLVFPHELMRVMLMEQIYRAQEIERGGKYHHL